MWKKRKVNTEPIMMEIPSCLEPNNNNDEDINDIYIEYDDPDDYDEQLEKDVVKFFKKHGYDILDPNFNPL